jgi:hypothetical protein
MIALLSVLVGAVIGAALSRWTDRAKHHEELRSQAYADYLSAVALSAHMRTSDDASNARRNGADAKARIAVYGSADVIRALARFEEAGASLVSGPSVNAFVSLVSTMRPKSGAVAERDLSLLLLGGPRSPQ